MKKIIYFIAIMLSFVSLKANAEEFKIAAKHAIAVEASTGKILYEKNATSPKKIASITKALSLYLVFKEIKEGRLSWNTQIPISDYAYNLIINTLASNVPLDTRKYNVSDLVNASIVANANSATIALAEYISGSEAQFVDKMKKQLQLWGVTNAKLVNATGLNNSLLGDHRYPNSKPDAENKMSALDVAKVVQHLITEFPEILNISSQAASTFSNQTIYSYNYMLKGMPYYRKGVDGLFTGTTESGVSSFVTTSVENNMRVIAVVLDTEHAQTDEMARFEAANTVLNYVVKNYKKVTLIPKGKTYQNYTSKVIDGQKKSVSAITSTDFTVIRNKSDQKPASIGVHLTKPTITAPVKKGLKLGTASYNDKSLVGKGYLFNKPTVDLIAKSKIEPAHFLTIWWNHFVNYVNEKL